MSSPRLRALAFPVLLLLLASCRAQEVPAASAPYGEHLQAMLAHTAAEAVALSKKLPSFACRETVASELLSGDKLKKRMDIIAEIRVRHGLDGDLSESFTPNQVDGKPFQSAKRLNMPIYLNGGFQHALDYFSPELQSCFHYTLNGNRIDFKAISDPLNRFGCVRELGVTGFALFDSDGEIAHVERRIPEEIASRFDSAPFAVLDLTSVSLDGETYRLSSHVQAEMKIGKGIGRFEGTYTNCRLFTANVTIRPGSTVITGDTPDASPK